jgi:hypothetical protein
LDCAGAVEEIEMAANTKTRMYFDIEIPPLLKSTECVNSNIKPRKRKDASLYRSFLNS